ncbi:uncharacterized protein LOC135400678 [Ornithodoros turicata]|uniref:uncharacterized protein LOC135400678 n=1 Tax=Ornithodoros turicata TaxID=34597 RepID=UPI003138F2A8
MHEISSKCERTNSRMMVTYWLIVLNVVFFATAGSDWYDENAEWCGRVLVHFLSQAPTMLNCSVWDYTESMNSNSLTLKYGSVIGFYDIMLLKANMKKQRTVTELMVHLEVPLLALRSYDLFESSDGDRMWLHLIVAAKNVRFGLGLHYTARDTHVYASHYLDMDIGTVTIEEKDVDAYVFPIAQLARDTFHEVLTGTIPQALIETCNDPALRDVFDRAGCL